MIFHFKKPYLILSTNFYLTFVIKETINLKSNIYLIGMMGSGKSTIGKMLSKQLNKSLIDVDYKIEDFFGISIAQIFERYGEERFRRIEETYFVEKSKSKNLIFSTGGGIILSKKNRQILQLSKKTIYLKTSPKQLLFNMKNNYSNRPLILNSKLSPIDTIKEISKKRDLMYKKSSHITIETDDLSKIELLNKVINCVI